MKTCLLVLAVGLLARAFEPTAAFGLPGSPAQAPTSNTRLAPIEPRQTNPHPKLQGYTLPPEKRARAIAYSRARYQLYFVGVALSLATYFFLWRSRLAALFGDWARRACPRHFAQCLVFVPLLVAVACLVEFPLDYYSGFALEHGFDLSTQGFGSWLGDWSKSLGITMLLGVLIVWILYLIIRRSPRRWWLYSWLATVPLTLAWLLVQPLVIDPLFYNFTPLEKTRPALTARIEQMLGRAGLEIPPSRIFEMDASRKTKTVDAYVTGVGGSKRVVVWDTTLRKLDEDETLLVLGHETGHYVLHHIPKELALIELLALVLFYLGFLWLRVIIRKKGLETGIRSVGDLASLPVMALVLTLLWSLSSPIINGISRHYEHQADQFGLEVGYGAVADPNSAEARSLQTLGEEDLSDPAPNSFIKFWLYSHPPLDERIRFAVSYQPWAEGKRLEFVHPRR